MSPTETTPVLADAADVLSDQLHGHLQRLVSLLAPHAGRLETRFLGILQKRRFDSKQRSALAAITLGAAARLLAAGHPLLKYFEQVEYNGRRLAKLNLPPSAIVGALAEYDRLLAPALRSLGGAETENFRWVREQLHFCVTLTLNNAYYQVREAETQAFYELFRVEVESRNLDELLERFLVTLSEFCHSKAAHLYLKDEQSGAWIPRAAVGKKVTEKTPVESSRALARAFSRPRYIEMGDEAEAALLDPTWHQRFSSCWSIPLASDGRPAGIMQFAFGKSYEWLPREQDLLAVAAERCLMAADKARLMEDLAIREEQIRRLAEHMLHVEEVERRRIGRELHDEAGQSLLCIRLQLEMLEQAPPPNWEEWKTRLGDVRDLTERTILEIRRLIAALSPAVLEQLGLGAALRQLVSRFRRVHPCRVRLHLTRLGGLPQKLEIIVYRLVQECCNNVAKHSGAGSVNISVGTADGLLRLQVEDDGVGFVVEEALGKRESFGLAGLRERVTLLGGEFQVFSRPVAEAGRGKSGTRILIQLPVSKDGETAKAVRYAS